MKLGPLSFDELVKHRLRSRSYPTRGLKLEYARSPGFTRLHSFLVGVAAGALAVLVIASILGRWTWL